jgi:LPS-assembly protein
MVAFTYWRAAASLGLLLAAVAARSQEDGRCQPAAPPLRLAAASPGATANPLKLPSVSALPTEVSSTDAHLLSDGSLELDGDVIVHSGDRLLQARHATVDPTRNLFGLDGEVVFADSLARIYGQTGSYVQSTGFAQLNNTQFELVKQMGRGEALQIQVPRPGLIDLQQVTYTTCPKGDSDWQLRATLVELNTDTQRGIGHDARIEFEGVPIMYLPWISFPLSDARLSGFLFPTIGNSSRSGPSLTIPWYWNIAPNQDLTLEPTIYTNRGEDLGVEYRTLSVENMGTAQVDYMPEDRTTGTNRSYEKVDDVLNLPDQWRLQLHAMNVSDTAYFDDFSQGTQPTSTVYLPRLLSAGYRDDRWQTEISMLQFQTLDLTLPDNERPYAQLPRIDTIATFGSSGGLRADISGELVDFTHDVGVTGWRADVQPMLSWDLTRPGYYLRPSVAWDLTGYRLENTVPGTSDAPTRNLPIVTVDSALQFVRDPVGSNLLITLEPRLYYVYIPYRDQSTLPVFDSGLPDANTVTLFRPNRYVGLDRIGDANELTLGLTTRMFQSSTGLRYLSATIGEGFYFEQPRVDLPTAPLTPGLRSDAVADIDLTAYKNWTVLYTLAWNPELSQTDQSEVGLQYRPAGNEVVNLGYRFNRGSMEQVDASVAWPISRRWDVYARSVYSILDRQALDNFAGFQYHGACWGLRLLVRKAVTTTPTHQIGAYDTTEFLELELNGLSSVGNGAGAFLQSSIQGYSANTPTH